MMKRRRFASAAVPAASAKPALRSSTAFNQIKSPSTPCMSYKDLIKVVGVDPESNPLYWRKAIDHSAETVVFFQVDLRGTLPRMSKSVRICREQAHGDSRQGRLIPSVYVKDTMLSSDYVKAVIGRRFLADEDDLMKLLEHAGVLQADEEAGEENDEERKDEEWDEGEAENEPYRAAPVPKRRKVSGKKHSGLPQKTAISRSQASVVERDAESNADVSGSRRPVDVLVNALDKPSTSSAETAAEEDADVDLSGLPSGDDQDDMPLGYDETGSPRLDSEDEHAEAGLEGEHDPGDASEPRTHTAAPSYEGRDFSFEEVLALIDGVQAQPFLWQKSSIAGLGTAARTQERRVAWANVAEMVNQTGTGVPKSCQDCMWKWENVRATYRRLVRTNAERTTTWPFIEKLAFTKPEIMQRRKRRVYNSKKIPSTT